MSWTGVEASDMQKRAMLLLFMYRPYKGGDWLRGEKFMPQWEYVVNRGRLTQWSAIVVNLVISVFLVLGVTFVLAVTAQNNAGSGDALLLYGTITVFFLLPVFAVYMYTRDAVKLLYHLLSKRKRV